MFDCYVMVDWSAAAVPRLGRDSIWVAALRRRRGKVETLLLENLATRADAKAVLRGLSIASLARGERTLLGFDFPFAYPAGLAGRHGHAGAPQEAHHHHVRGIGTDGHDHHHHDHDHDHDHHHHHHGHSRRESD